MRYLLVFVFIVVGCINIQNDGLEFIVDMSNERDDGRFNPDLGDVISIAGTFNNWEPNKNILIDPDGDWNYSITLTNVPETGEFKFVISSKSNLDLPNSGWEIIPNRKISKIVVENESPILRFNEAWSPIEVLDITFAVSMSNQEILDFFDPEKDQVVVTGSFIGWDYNGITLEDADEDGVFEQTVPIEINPVKPHSFKYRIDKPSSFDGYIPNDGWEFIDDRFLMTQSSDVHYFNDQKRVARFLVEERWLTANLTEAIKRSDMYQIRFFVGEESYLSEPLQKATGNYYETSLQIPLIVDIVKWTVVKNQNDELTDLQETVVTHKGAVITVK